MSSATHRTTISIGTRKIKYYLQINLSSHIILLAIIASMTLGKMYDLKLCPNTEKQILRSWDRASLMYSSITNKMQRYTMVFITINALHVSGGSSDHHQELKTVNTASGICRVFSASYRHRD